MSIERPRDLNVRDLTVGQPVVTMSTRFGGDAARFEEVTVTKITKTAVTLSNGKAHKIEQKTTWRDGGRIRGERKTDGNSWPDEDATMLRADDPYVAERKKRDADHAEAQRIRNDAMRAAGQAYQSMSFERAEAAVAALTAYLENTRAEHEDAQRRMAVWRKEQEQRQAL